MNDGAWSGSSTFGWNERPSFSSFKCNACEKLRGFVVSMEDLDKLKTGDVEAFFRVVGVLKIGILCPKCLAKVGK